MTSRLATYNIHKFVGRDGRRDEDRVLAIIAAMNADILALQEFVLEDHSADGTQVARFAEKAGYHFIAQPLCRLNGMMQFNLLLSRTKIQHHNLVTLPRDGKEPRGAINATLEIGAENLQISATHLGLDPLARARHLKMILDFGAQQENMPFALMGDLNILSSLEPAYRHLAKTFAGQKQPPSFPARLPFFACDAIYLRHIKAPPSVRSFTEGDARKASDHLPLIADIAFG
jgi:endonuclease/exonuclease/phosphatase family metal-dependent hydrolase